MTGDLGDFFLDEARREAALWPEQATTSAYSGQPKGGFYVALDLFYSWGRVTRSCDFREERLLDNIMVRRELLTWEQVRPFLRARYPGEWWSIDAAPQRRHRLLRRPEPPKNRPTSEANIRAEIALCGERSRAIIAALALGT